MISDCRLPIADWGLPTEDCRFLPLCNFENLCVALCNSYTLRGFTKKIHAKTRRRKESFPLLPDCRLLGRQGSRWFTQIILRFKIADCWMQIADCRLRIANLSLQHLLTGSVGFSQNVTMLPVNSRWWSSGIASCYFEIITYCRQKLVDHKMPSCTHN